ncbi:MAG: glycoside hydrolase family 65 protein, partial [Bacillota bacterium]
MRDFHYKKLIADSLYDYEPWNITEDNFQIENNHHNESIFALGNGYMGLRGTLEEDYPGDEGTTTPGFYINGIYGSEKIIYGEEAPNQPENSQTIVNLADWTSINFYIAGEKFNMSDGEIKDYTRTLNMKEGY